MAHSIDSFYMECSSKTLFSKVDHMLTEVMSNLSMNSIELGYKDSKDHVSCDELNLIESSNLANVRRIDATDDAENEKQEFIAIDENRSIDASSVNSGENIIGMEKDIYFTNNNDEDELNYSGDISQEYEFNFLNWQTPTTKFTFYAPPDGYYPSRKHDNLRNTVNNVEKSNSCNVATISVNDPSNELPNVPVPEANNEKSDIKTLPDVRSCALDVESKHAESSVSDTDELAVKISSKELFKINNEMLNEIEAKRKILADTIKLGREEFRKLHESAGRLNLKEKFVTDVRKRKFIEAQLPDDVQGKKYKYMPNEIPQYVCSAEIKTSEINLQSHQSDKKLYLTTHSTNTSFHVINITDEMTTKPTRLNELLDGEFFTVLQNDDGSITMGEDKIDCDDNRVINFMNLVQQQSDLVAPPLLTQIPLDGKQNQHSLVNEIGFEPSGPLYNTTTITSDSSCEVNPMDVLSKNRQVSTPTKEPVKTNKDADWNTGKNIVQGAPYSRLNTPTQTTCVVENTVRHEVCSIDVNPLNDVGHVKIKNSHTSPPSREPAKVIITGKYLQDEPLSSVHNTATPIACLKKDTDKRKKHDGNFVKVNPLIDVSPVLTKTVIAKTNTLLHPAREAAKIQMENDERLNKRKNIVQNESPLNNMKAISCAKKDDGYSLKANLPNDVNRVTTKNVYTSQLTRETAKTKLANDCYSIKVNLPNDVSRVTTKNVYSSQPTREIAKTKVANDGYFIKANLPNDVSRVTTKNVYSSQPTREIAKTKVANDGYSMKANLPNDVSRVVTKNVYSSQPTRETAKTKVANDGYSMKVNLPNDVSRVVTNNLYTSQPTRETVKTKVANDGCLDYLAQDYKQTSSPNTFVRKDTFKHDGNLIKMNPLKTDLVSRVQIKHLHTSQQSRETAQTRADNNVRLNKLNNNAQDRATATHCLINETATVENVINNKRRLKKTRGVQTFVKKPKNQIAQTKNQKAHIQRASPKNHAPVSLKRTLSSIEWFAFRNPSTWCPSTASSDACFSGGSSNKSAVNTISIDYTVTTGQLVDSNDLYEESQHRKRSQVCAKNSHCALGKFWSQFISTTKARGTPGEVLFKNVCLFIVYLGMFFIIFCALRLPPPVCQILL